MSNNQRKTIAKAPTKVVTQTPQVIQTRKMFPETWIFDVMNDAG